MATTLTPVKTLYASFPEPCLAERAAAALLDLGARPEDISLVYNATVAEIRERTEVEDEAIGGWQPANGAAPVSYRHSVEIKVEGAGDTPAEAPYLDDAK